MTVTDDDTVGVTVTPTELTIDEGASSTYTVVLDTQPTADVTVTIEGPAFPFAVGSCLADLHDTGLERSSDCKGERQA